jgi:hypothetical protein
MEGQGLMHAIMEECSGGQPSYDVEVYHDGEGKCYFRGGWPKFFADYSLREGWSLIFSRRNGMRDFCVCIIDDSFCARSYRIGVNGEHPPTFPCRRGSRRQKALEPWGRRGNLLFSRPLVWPPM